MGYIPGGYGWVFPKGDHANVGVGGWDSQGPHLRDHLRDVCVRHGIAWESLTELRGHRLPTQKDQTQPQCDRQERPPRRHHKTSRSCAAWLSAWSAPTMRRVTGPAGATRHPRPAGR